MYQILQLEVGGYDHNFSYLITAGNKEAALVDPTGDLEVLTKAINREAVIPKYILLTHGHLDHFQQLGEILSIFPAEVISHPNHPMYKHNHITDHKHLPFGEKGYIEIIFSPGHTRDSVMYRLDDDSALFTGDTLFIDYIGFCRSKEMYATLTKKVLPLSDKLVVYSGHDYGSVKARTLGEEKLKNKFLDFCSYDEFKQRLQELG